MAGGHVLLNIPAAPSGRNRKCGMPVWSVCHSDIRAHGGPMILILID